MGIVNGLKQIWKATKNNTKNSLDHFWLGEEGQKAIRDEVEKKFQPKIDLARRAEDRRANNITELGNKLAQSEKDLQDAKNAWRSNHDSALANAKNQRQTDISNYDTELQRYQDAVDRANASRQSIVDQLYKREATYDPYKTLYIDVDTGNKYIVNRITGKYENLSTLYSTLDKKQKRVLNNYINGFEDRLYSSKSGKVINAFDDSDSKTYQNNNIFNNYLGRVKAPQNIALRDADNQINRAQSDLTKWQSNNTRPQDWDDNIDLQPFEKNFKKSNGSSPTVYTFNGQNYSKKADLDKAYREALTREQTMQSRDSGRASRYISKRDAEIAQRIQNAKDINKVKAALGLGTAGALAGATYAAFSGDDNSNTKPVSLTVTPQTTEGIETQFEHPAETDSISGISLRDQEAALADMAFKAASESDDTSAETHPEIPELAELSADDIHTNEGIGTRRSMNEGLFSVIKALQDPHQANAVADYIYSRYGNDPELQQLGWRAWLNKYYGDALRSQMNLDASGYNGMHIA